MTCNGKLSILQYQKNEFLSIYHIMIDTGLKGKTAIVTGANHGIGAATAIAFAREGARVLITYLRQSPDLYGETRTNAESATVPGRAYYCREIGQPEDIARAVIFFASDQAEWITGQVLQVGGGNRM